MKTVAIIGAGHNGLVAAFYLAKAGFKPIVLERQPVVGGCAITGEIASGHQAPLLSHVAGPLRPAIVEAMGLAHRVTFIQPDPRLISLLPDRRALVFSHDTARTADAIRAFSDADAAAYPEFRATLERLSAVLVPLLERTPPSIDGPSASDLWEAIKAGRRFRALGRTDAYRLLRWMPMAVADLVSESFTTDAVQAAIATRGVLGTAMGPWSGGTGAVLLLNAALDPVPGGSTVIVRGGPGALSRALADAAREAGAEIRVEAEVAQVLVRDGRAAGVLLRDGTEVAADAVVSNADPRRTFLQLVDPVELEPTFLQRVRHYRVPGTLAKLTFVLGTVPTFEGVTGAADLHGRILIAPGIDYIERAFDAWKYGQIPAEPFLEITIPSLADPSLSPDGRSIVSVYAQFVPYALAKGSSWPVMRDHLATVVIRTIERYAPGFGNLIEHQQVLTPVDLEERYGLSGGHILHGEPSLDQLFTMRPLLGWAQYRTPIDGLFLCGAGTHPGGGITGAPGWNAAREIRRVLAR